MHNIMKTNLSMGKAVLAILMALFLSSNIMASETDFTQIKNSLNEKSLPLVNISVEIGKVSKDDYTEGQIEIVSYQENDNIQEETFLCKVKYRGASSLGYEKKIVCR